LQGREQRRYGIKKTGSAFLSSNTETRDLKRTRGAETEIKNRLGSDQ